MFGLAIFCGFHVKPVYYGPYFCFTILVWDHLSVSKQMCTLRYFFRIPSLRHANCTSVRSTPTNTSIRGTPTNTSIRSTPTPQSTAHQHFSLRHSNTLVHGTPTLHSVAFQHLNPRQANTLVFGTPTSDATKVRMLIANAS